MDLWKQLLRGSQNKVLYSSARKMLETWKKFRNVLRDKLYIYIALDLICHKFTIYVMLNYRKCTLKHVYSSFIDLQEGNSIFV